MDEGLYKNEDENKVEDEDKDEDEKKMKIELLTSNEIGIGLQLTSTLLLRENTIVIATKRAISTDSSGLERLSKAQGSRLIVITLGSDIGDGRERKNTADDLVERLKSQGVDRIDTLILNAGAATSFQSVAETSIEELQAHFQINTVWPIRIYQILRPLLLKYSSSVSNVSDGFISSKEGEEKRFSKKVIYISSYLGSIGGMEDSTPSLAYGISKAAGNYFVRKVHFEEGSGFVCLAVHPGYVFVFYLIFERLFYFYFCYCFEGELREFWKYGIRVRSMDRKWLIMNSFHLNIDGLKQITDKHLPIVLELRSLR